LLDGRGDPLRFIADLHISPITVEILRAEGWDVVWVWEELSPFAPDPEILDFARGEGRAILTQDLDFSTLLALSGRNRPSLVTLRLSDSQPQIVARKILGAQSELEQKLTEGYAITIEDHAIRFRKLPIR
jgi:predicted nuclease of predicted toxin-antitoxin system